jgi:hypothetical protein
MFAGVRHLVRTRPDDESSITHTDYPQAWFVRERERA